MKPTLVVLAAGMGSRYGGLKQMDPMGPNGESVLDYSVFDAIRAGFGKVVYVIRRDFEDAFRESVGSKFEGKIEIDYAFQQLDDLPAGFSLPDGREKPWGTAHAVWAARDVVDGQFAVINADDFYGANAYQVAADFMNQASGTQYALVGYSLENTLSEHGGVNRGIVESDNGHLKSVEEVVEITKSDTGIVSGTGIDGSKRELATDSVVSMNFWTFSPDFFQQIETGFVEFLEQRAAEEKSEFYIPTIVDELSASGNASCEVVTTSSTWFGVTYPDDKPAVVVRIRELIDSGDYPESLV